MWTGVLCALLAGALWGMVFIVPELLPAFSPLELALGHYTAYGVIAFALMLPRLRPLLRRLERSDHGALLRHALSGNIVYYVLLALDVKLAGVAPTSLIIGVLPIAITLMGRKDHGAVALGRLALPLLVVGAGIVCINVDTFGQAQAGHADLARTRLGTLFALLYGFIYAHRFPRPLEVAAIVLLAIGVMWPVRVHAVEEAGYTLGAPQ